MLDGITASFINAFFVSPQTPKPSSHRVHGSFPIAAISLSDSGSRLSSSHVWRRAWCRAHARGVSG